ELNEEISPEDAAREFAREYLTVMFDKKDQEPEMSIEIVDSSDEETPEELRRQQVLTKLVGDIPEGAKEFLLYLDPRCPMAVVMVVIKDAQPTRRMQVILAGEYSRPVSVLPVVEGDPFAAETTGKKTSPDTRAAATAPPADAADPVGPAETNAPDDSSDEAEGEVSPVGGAGAALGAGWRSYFQVSWLPVLLTVGLFLLTLGRKPVFAQVAALLVSQSLVVALAAWYLLPVPAWSATALAVVVVAICGEALFHRRARSWRVPLVVAGGLFSGLVLAGSAPFAATFSASGTGRGEVLAFLLGSEGALVLVALVTAAVLLPLSRFAWYRRVVVEPVAVVVIGAAIFSSVEKYL
ncbi:MAG: hypothetical protein GXX91_14800, partial [Verrucomicrobiaceae bacterium]|nr:hypothetical protein [Verrucomicrobiaceae bacterium]